ncbi:hypothetical protein ABZ726_36945 [Streptomyces hundungensis]|uniref:hypothetical protein n=1 Tax=Streptomyces hundungensis TaxID=1077946 RepID=UPI0033CCDD49
MRTTTTPYRKSASVFFRSKVMAVAWSPRPETGEVFTFLASAVPWAPETARSNCFWASASPLPRPAVES